jgi:hypothetical protein
MIDIFLRRGETGKAWNLCQQARSKGYIGTALASNDPILEMIYRKVEALINKAAAQANPGRAAP